MKQSIILLNTLIAINFSGLGVFLMTVLVCFLPHRNNRKCIWKKWNEDCNNIFYWTKYFLPVLSVLAFFLQPPKTYKTTNPNVHRALIYIARWIFSAFTKSRVLYLKKVVFIQERNFIQKKFVLLLAKKARKLFPINFLKFCPQRQLKNLLKQHVLTFFKLDIFWLRYPSEHISVPRHSVSAHNNSWHKSFLP